jgi:hypothetical protein
MEQVLLWASFAVGIAVYLFCFLPLSGDRSSPMDSDANEELPSDCHPALRGIGIASPFVGFLLTLPTQGFFSSGQQLGIGFLLGGIGALLCQVRLGTLLRVHQKLTTASEVIVAATYGVAIATVATATLFLPVSRPDSLMGVAIGWFCVSTAFFFSLPDEHRDGATGRVMVQATGLVTTLSAAVLLGIYRDPMTRLLPKLSWSTLLLSFVALSVLLLAGIVQLPFIRRPGKTRLLPLIFLIVGGSAGLYQLAVKLTDSPRIAFIGMGGLLLWPVVTAVLRETQRRSAITLNALPSAFLPVVLITAAVVAAIQVMQGVGAATVVLAAYLSMPATLMLFPTNDSFENAEQKSLNIANVGLLLFGSLLVLWRLFIVRWGDDLRGVNLTDQYALFGILIGVALPTLLANLSASWKGGKEASTAVGVLVLGVTAIVALVAPAFVLILFGPKSIVALMIGLAIGVLFSLARVSALLPALLALAVGLALDQWAGRLLPDQTPTRLEKVRYLVSLMAVVVTVTLGSDILTRWQEGRGKR